MSEYGANQSSEEAQQYQQNVSSDTLETAAGSANNSIIGKVKSRVSSIIPNSLSKWWSPSANKNDSINGSLNSSSGAVGGGTTGLSGGTRRRRRIEIEEDYDDDQQNNNSDDDQIEDDDGSNSSDDENTTAITATHLYLKSPPSKRSRFNLDISNMRDSPLMQHQPLIASTPAVGSNLQSNISQQSPTFQYLPRDHLNLCATNQSKVKSTPIDISSNRFESGAVATAADIQPSSDSRLENMRRNLDVQQHIVSERPSTSGFGLSNLKRQSLSSVKNSDMPSTSAGIGRERSIAEESTTILSKNTTSNQSRGGDNKVFQSYIEDDEEDVIVSGTIKSTKYNGLRWPAVTSKKQKLMNGLESSNADDNVDVGDSGSECSEVGSGARETDNTDAVQQRKTGLFNMSAANSSRNGSRTSSFGNGLNFYSHLDGRKSLFSGTGGQATNAAGNTMNNSTLSLTSLNRRQFNASIYGSTSALSDSRLLNTFSPFYKGKTTYGGAAAYNKYSTIRRGMVAGVTGASAVRITPTLIRPTSSLSTLSSSSNSIAVAAAATVGSSAVTGEATGAISSTAKRILDLINDFATPLSEAKKMANNLKTNQQQLLPTSKRLTDADLQASRAMRLSQVRTPYMRPMVTLSNPMTHFNGGAKVLPPVRELQVPSMSQLLQMKKMQSTTERSRHIATQATAATKCSVEYKLPVVEDKGGDGQASPVQTQQRHTNKIKSKVSSSMRVTSSKNVCSMVNETPPSPVNLPQLAFPLMQSVPKIDIPLTTSSPMRTYNTRSSIASTELLKTVAECKDSQKSISNAFNSDKYSKSKQTINDVQIIAPTTKITSPATKAYKFSAPLELKGVTTSLTQNFVFVNGNFKFSSPTNVLMDATADISTIETPKSKMPQTEKESLPPQLKTGSVLDALKTPFTIPTSQASTVKATALGSDNNISSFGDQFKKSSNEWECDTCMVRNKQETDKCVACETPRKISLVAPKSNDAAISSLEPSSFGSQFKKSSSEWECDVCMIRNKQEASKCVACETPRKGASAVANATGLVSQYIKYSFGHAFKPKANTWDCSTCLVTNKNESNACVACQTKKPGTDAAVPSAPTFLFGFAPTASTAADAGFKSIAAEQKVSKWECEACMTRNDAARSKCVCCDQAKPGTQTTNENVPKFSFGSTAAAKFNFGFGAVAGSASKDVTQSSTTTASTQKTEAATTSKGFVFGSAVTASTTTSATSTSSGFSFGIKPAVATDTKTTTVNDPDVSKDVADTSKNKTPTTATAFKFGVDTSNTTSTTTGFTFGTASLAVATTKSMPTPMATTTSSSSTSSPSVKFSLPKTTITTTNTASALSEAKTSAAAPPTFSFGASASKPGGGISFGKSPSKSAESGKATADLASSSPAISEFAFKPTSVSATAANTNSFTFGASPTTSPSTATVAVKPTFSFASPSSSAPTTSKSATTTTTSSTGGFNFGSGAAALTPTTKSLFGAASANATTVAVVPTSMTSIANPIVFGSFGGGSSGTSNSITTSSSSAGFGGVLASKVSFSASAGTTSAPTSTFGTFVSATAPSGSSAVSSTNVFGSFGGSGDSKPTALNTPIFGNTSSTTAAAKSDATFVFGSAAPVATEISTNNSSSTAVAITSSNTSTSTTWPKNNFFFGASSSNAPVSASGSNANEPSKYVFGSFGGSTQATTTNTTSSNPASSSIFGNITTPATTTPTAGTSFGNGANVQGANNIFGANSASAVSSGNGVGSTNLFGSTPSSNATTPAPAFTSSPFGGNSASPSVTPTFGSTAAGTSTTFGGFGTSNAATASAAAGSSDGASAAKKSEPSFQFGGVGSGAAIASAQQSTSGGFNFGSTAVAAKPAFNFAPSSQPAFNFTGATETPKAKPFQFGATPSAPMFNFGGGAVEATPNAPFQFNAGTAPASSNIFAPTPTQGAPATQQQARRKIRAPIRRLATPR